MSYRRDMRMAWDRIDRFPSQRLETTRGTVEYADRGDGIAVLISHGVLGSHVDAVDSNWASLTGDGFRIIAPARFGYFGSTLPVGATPADQADVYAQLLDHLGVQRTAAIGFSAGSGSILEFARRYRERTTALVLACCRVGGGVTISERLKPVLWLAYGADPLFWAFERLMPTAFSTMMGAPKGFRPSPEVARTLAAYRKLLFPLRPRRDGAIFDGYVSNKVADRFVFEDLQVPTLVINARDDHLAPYRFAERAAQRIPNAELLTIEDGGHLFLGHADEVRAAIQGFVEVHT